MAFKIFSGNVVPEKLVPLLSVIQQETGVRYQSVFRGKSARKLLAKVGKHDQAYLYDGWIHHRPGFLPANPPGRSTHELRSDGVAYRGPVGRRLHWWQVGIDVDDAHVDDFIRAANRHGWHAHITYPNSKLEHHHINLTREPKYSPYVLWRTRPIHRGDVGPRARWVLNTLRYVRDPDTKKPYLTVSGKPARRIGDHQVDAIKRFQRDHHQKADGKVGLQTYRQMAAARRAEKKRRAAERKKK